MGVGPSVPMNAGSSVLASTGPSVPMNAGSSVPASTGPSVSVNTGPSVLASTDSYAQFSVGLSVPVSSTSPSAPVSAGSPERSGMHTYEASTSPVVGGTLMDSGLNPAGTAEVHWNLYLQLHSIIAEVNIFVAQKVTGCLDKLHIQSPSMQMKKWLAQKTLYTNAALLTRSLGKPSITPTQAKKLVTQGFDLHTLLLLRRTSDTKDAFVASLKQKGIRSKPLGEMLYRALCST